MVGCCGIESYHIRAMAEELEQERNSIPKGINLVFHICLILEKLKLNIVS